VVENELAEGRVLKKALDVAAGRVDAANNVLEFAPDPGAEQVAGAADDSER
jgi:hypothetical protein